MIKKKSKKKANGKKAGKKPRKKRAVRKDKDPAEVRKEISGMVKSSAKGICKAVVGHAMQGELAPAKYLFEMAQIFREPNALSSRRKSRIAWRRCCLRS